MGRHMREATSQTLHVREVHVEDHCVRLGPRLGPTRLHRFLLRVQLDCELGLEHFLPLSTPSDQAQPPVHILEVDLASLVLSKHYLTHFPNASADRPEERLLEILPQRGCLEDDLEGLFSCRVHLGDMQDAV